MNIANMDIPFWHPDAISLGPLELHPFGLLVATGVMFGAYCMRRWGESNDLKEQHIQGLVWYCVGIGFICAHVFDVLAYQPGKLAEDPLLLFKLWQGISSFGGFIGGVLGFVLYVKRYKIPVGPYADASLVAFIPGFTFGRMGCSVAHDHIGAYTEDFFLATEYTREVIFKYGFGNPPGGLKPGLHHNLGFYELLFMLVLCAVLFGVSRWKKRPHGFMAATMGTLYAPVRFVMEFFRVNPEADPRYAGLTFAQWMSLVLFLVGVYALVYMVRKNAANLAEADAVDDDIGSEKGASGARKKRAPSTAADKRADMTDDAAVAAGKQAAAASGKDSSKRGSKNKGKKKRRKKK